MLTRVQALFSPADAFVHPIEHAYPFARMGERSRAINHGPGLGEQRVQWTEPLTLLGKGNAGIAAVFDRGALNVAALAAPELRSQRIGVRAETIAA